MDYCSLDFNVGARVSTQPGESVVDALDRTREIVLGYLDENADDTYDVLDKAVNRQGRR